MNIRDKASRLRVNAQVAAERAVTPATEFVKNQRNAHREAVDAKCADLAEKRVERAEETSKPMNQLQKMQQEFVDSVKEILK